MMNRRKIGKKKEAQAVLYLEKKGYEVLQCNYWTHFGEIDIIAREDGYLCFVEVKYRANNRYDAPEGVITRRKEQRMGKSAYNYLREKCILPDTPIRFDVVMMVGEEITLFKNAFGFGM